MKIPDLILQNMNPAGVDCPVIGGNDGPTVVPLVSQCAPRWKKGELSDDDLRNLTKQIQVKSSFKRTQKVGLIMHCHEHLLTNVNFFQMAGRTVVDATVTRGATLSAAYAAARFTNSMLKSLSGDLNVMECAYIRTDVAGCKYFAAHTHFSVSTLKFSLASTTHLICSANILFDPTTQ